MSGKVRVTTSVLARIDKSQIVYDPFPYVVVTEALEPSYHAELADRQGTSFAVLSLYIDVVHHSRLGVERLLQAIEPFLD